MAASSSTLPVAYATGFSRFMGRIPAIPAFPSRLPHHHLTFPQAYPLRTLVGVPGCSWAHGS